MLNKTDRLQSLDAFRGLTIAGMILVNNPGSWSHVYPPLRHAEWHGWTPTDLIFPFFLFIIGVAMVFSLERRLHDSSNRKGVYLKIVRRTLIILGLALVLKLYPTFDLATIRIPGVLVRIAVVYFFAAIITLNTNIKGQVIWMTILLFLYWGLMTLVPVPGYGAGDLSMEGNLAAYIDNSLMHGHTWKETWDPEGILSTMPAIATTLSGVLTGHLIRSKQERSHIAGWMFVGGWGAILLGMIWSIWFPINKNLWTSSYVVFTTGSALQFLGVCYWLIDVKGWKKWAYPALVYGMNSIAVYVLSGMLARTLTHIKVDGGLTLQTWLYQTYFASWAGPLNGSLMYAVANIVFWFGAMAVLYHKRIFIKV